MDVRLRTRSADETRGVGEVLASLLRPRDAVILTGELGAGKTTLVQGVARGLGVEDHVASPTFTLVREYAGRLGISHVDVYRLDRIQEVVDLGLEELGDGDNVLLVEWGDVVEEILPAERLRIELTTEGSEELTDARSITLTAVGPSWVERWDRLERSLEFWRPPA